jgi:hypothetical protein
MRRRTWISTSCAIAVLGLTYGDQAMAGTFGTDPIPISTAPGGKPSNGASGGAAVSGDNRKTRIAAFHSDASNLVRGDSNGVTDVFIWYRPKGHKGIALSRPGGSVVRASVSNSGKQANGPSTHPALDGSITSKPHCIAFQSEASNLAAGDGNTVSDIFVRDLRSHRTILVSRGIGPAATAPTIDGHCGRVAFSAGGRVYVAAVKGGKPRSMGSGSQPDLGLDGSALTWVSGSRAVMLNRAGHTNVVAPHGRNPRVSDREVGVWGVVFDTNDRLAKNDRNSTADAYTRTMRAGGGHGKTDLISASGRGGRGFGESANGGITAYGVGRGIITFLANEGGQGALYYRNNHTGNIDDLAYGSITGVATSARANFVAFTSLDDSSRFDSNGLPDVYFKHLIDGEAL